jgi:hypothetical protein
MRPVFKTLTDTVYDLRGRPKRASQSSHAFRSLELHGLIKSRIVVEESNRYAEKDTANAHEYKESERKNMR